MANLAIISTSLWTAVGFCKVEIQASNQDKYRVLSIDWSKGKLYNYYVI